ncbi:MAG: 4-(cytidine 5'-diphospho)-2-C-methyl-D-erythritol kinase, partial [Flavitalea sp.]
PDGYHDLETIFYPLPFRDALEIVLQKQPANTQKNIEDDNGCQFFSTGLDIPGASQNNLCVKAWNLLKKDFPSLPPIDMHLHKAIPIGAGLGGGSSDGAFALLLVNRQFNLGLSDEKLADLALQLGSDCPFFILNKPCLATGRGEFLTRISLDLSGYFVVLVTPGIHISTGWAFSQIHPSAGERSLEEITALPVEKWKEALTNDFEQPIFGIHPQLAAIKKELYSMGALYACMSGTGSAIAGIFARRPKKFPYLLPHHFLIAL